MAKRKPLVTDTDLVVLTLQCQSGAKVRFSDMYEAMVKYAEQNNIEKPKKQELLTKILHRSLTDAKPQDFFN